MGIQSLMYGVQRYEQSVPLKCEALNSSPLCGVLQGSDTGHSCVPETWEGIRLCCKNLGVGNAFPGDGSCEGRTAQDSAFLTGHDPCHFLSIGVLLSPPLGWAQLC